MTRTLWAFLASQIANSGDFARCSSAWSVAIAPVATCSSSVRKRPCARAAEPTGGISVSAADSSEPRLVWDSVVLVFCTNH